MEYAKLGAELTRSYLLQLNNYKKLNALGQKILGQIVLSRGDFASTMHLFEDKKKIIDEITSERGRIASQSSTWQKNKPKIVDSVDVTKLDNILLETENAIKQFLDSEEQLKKYVSRLTSVGKWW